MKNEKRKFIAPELLVIDLSKYDEVILTSPKGFGDDGMGGFIDDDEFFG